MAVMLYFCFPGIVAAQEKPPAMNVQDRRTGEAVSWDDFRGKIVVLDFFAYWCAPCEPASRTIEAEIARHFAENGNTFGVPVEVLGINIEHAHPARTNAFVERVGMGRVLDDDRGKFLDGFGARSLPFLVVVDGTETERGRDGWRVVYQHNGFEGAARLREVINRIEGRDGS